ncbi:MAG: PDZ domain-containing protein [Gemmatimonadetes bacterium]|nr:PDZ domain-containing protein [Gemmatimonadota bacterium]
MKRMIFGLLVLLLTVGSSAGAQTDEERRELRQRLGELRREVRELERQLGERNFLRIGGPLVLSMFGNRGRLGVVVNTSDKPETDSIGAVLQAVTPDGPAAEAGLEAGDIVVTMNGERLTETRRRQSPGDRLVELARDLEEGDTVRVQYQRDGERRTATIVAQHVPGFAYRLGEPERIALVRSTLFAQDTMERTRGLVERLRLRGWDDAGRAWGIAIAGTRWADIELATLNDELGEYFGVTEGLLVVRAPREDLLGLKSGDVILRIGGRKPSSPSHAARILRSYDPGDELRIDIMRHKRRETVTAIVPERDRRLHWEGRP